MNKAKKPTSPKQAKKVTPVIKPRKLTPEQRLKRKQERMRAWRQAHPEASKQWKIANRKRYLKYLNEYWWGERHEELLAMKRKWTREHKEERRLYRLAVKEREQAAAAKRKRQVKPAGTKRNNKKSKP
jgi:hypothetical protein